MNEEILLKNHLSYLRSKKTQSDQNADSYLAIDSTSSCLWARQSIISIWGGCPSRLATVHPLRMASEVKVMLPDTSTPRRSQAHLIAVEAWECLAIPNWHLSFRGRRILNWWWCSGLLLPVPGCRFDPEAAEPRRPT